MRGSIYRPAKGWTIKIERPRRADGGRQYRYETVRHPQGGRAPARQLVTDLDAGTYIEPCTSMSRASLRVAHLRLDTPLGAHGGALHSNRQNST